MEFSIIHILIKHLTCWVKRQSKINYWFTLFINFVYIFCMLNLCENSLLLRALINFACGYLIYYNFIKSVTSNIRFILKSFLIFTSEFIFSKCRVWQSFSYVFLFIYRTHCWWYFIYSCTISSNVTMWFYVWVLVFRVIWRVK